MLKVQHITKDFSKMGLKKTNKKVIRDVTFTIEKGDTFGLIGESGSGKSTLANLILALEKPTSGDILFEEISVFTNNKLEKKELNESIQMVFQHPDSSLNPRMTIEKNMLELLKIQKEYTNYQDAIDKIKENLELVKLSENLLNRYPHEISGGEAQRVIIARALLSDVKLLVLDEPTSMLDASIQKQIMVLLEELKKKRNLSLLLITHDIEIARYCTNKLGILKEGQLIEFGLTQSIFKKPTHCYTQELVNNFYELSVPDSGTGTS